MSCSQRVEIEDLVLGTIEPSRARELRVHVAGCASCRREQAAVTEERALFTHREAALAAPPPAIAVALRAQLTAEVVAESAPLSAPANRLVRRGASALGRVLRRGYVSAACAALLFAWVAFSKPGVAPLLRAAEPAGAGREPSSGPAASLFSQLLGDATLACSGSVAMTSFSDETLACSVSVAMTSLSDETVLSSGATAQASSSVATVPEVLACGRPGEGSGASCEPSVTCSSLRQ